MNCFIFDIDGTLIDTEYGYMEGLRRAMLEQCGKDYEYKDIRKYFGLPSQETLDDLGVDDSDGSFLNRWQELFKELSYGKMMMFDGMKEVLKTIKCKGIPIGIVSSQSKEELDRTFHKYKLNEYIDIAVHADLTELHKPMPDPLNKFFELSGIPKEGAVYVGDSKHDWMCANAAGVKFCLAGWGCGDPSEISPDYSFQHPMELLKLL